MVTDAVSNAERNRNPLSKPLMTTEPILSYPINPGLRDFQVYRTANNALFYVNTDIIGRNKAG